jgi:hypothetical protein
VDSLKVNCFRAPFASSHSSDAEFLNVDLQLAVGPPAYNCDSVRCLRSMRWQIDMLVDSHACEVMMRNSGKATRIGNPQTPTRRYGSRFEVSILLPIWQVRFLRVARLWALCLENQVRFIFEQRMRGLRSCRTSPTSQQYLHPDFAFDQPAHTNYNNSLGVTPPDICLHSAVHESMPPRQVCSVNDSGVSGRLVLLYRVLPTQ